MAMSLVLAELQFGCGNRRRISYSVGSNAASGNCRYCTHAVCRYADRDITHTHNQKIMHLIKKASDTNSFIFLIFILTGMSIMSEVLNI